MNDVLESIGNLKIRLDEIIGYTTDMDDILKHKIPDKKGIEEEIHAAKGVRPGAGLKRAEDILSEIMSDIDGFKGKFTNIMQSCRGISYELEIIERCMRSSRPIGEVSTNITEDIN